MIGRSMIVPERALLVFLKAPVPGLVKTRLMPRWSAEDACDLHQAMVEDLLDRIDSIPDTALYLCFAPVTAGAAVREWLGGEHNLLAQRGNGLGERMQDAFRLVFGHGHERVLLAGNDVPDLDRTIIDRAFTALDRCEVAIGPALDGGYYLVGLRHPLEALFTAIDWGTAAVLRQTLERVRMLGLTVECLPTLGDVDTPGDALRLCVDLQARVSRRSRSPRTELVLRRVLGEANGGADG